MTETDRFELYIPGGLKTLWHRIVHHNDWRQRSYAVVTDHHHDCRFQMNEDEHVALSILGDVITDSYTLRETLVLKEDLAKATDGARDILFQAMSERRRGNAESWSKFQAMGIDDWRTWFWQFYERKS